MNETMHSRCDDLRSVTNLRAIRTELTVDDLNIVIEKQVSPGIQSLSLLRTLVETLG